MIIAVNFQFKQLEKKKPEKNQGFNGFEPMTSANSLQFKYMNYFIYTSHHFTPHGRNELNKLSLLPMCAFIAQLVEHDDALHRYSRRSQINVHYLVVVIPGIFS